MKATVDARAQLSMLRRFLNASAKYMDTCDETDLAQLVAMQEQLAELVTVAVKSMRDGGYSWREIGKAADISHVAAQLRWKDAITRLH